MTHRGDAIDTESLDDVTWGVMEWPSEKWLHESMSLATAAGMQCNRKPNPN